MWNRCSFLRDLDLFLKLHHVEEFPGCPHFIGDVSRVELEKQIRLVFALKSHTPRAIERQFLVPQADIQSCWRNGDQARSPYRKSNPNSIVESLCPTLSIRRLSLEKLFLYRNSHVCNFVFVRILRNLDVLSFVPKDLIELLQGEASTSTLLRSQDHINCVTERSPCDRCASSATMKVYMCLSTLVFVHSTSVCICFLEARLSQGLSLSDVRCPRSSVVGHPRPSLSGTGVPWVSCLDPPVCPRVQDDPEAKSQPVVVLG